MTTQNSAAPRSASRKKRLLAVCGLLLALSVILGALIWRYAQKNKIDLFPDSFGVPFRNFYEEELANSALSSDLAVFEGRLYVGCGDYGANTGPVQIASLAVGGGRWHLCSPLEDEQIKRFRVLGGDLVALGTDPREDWSLGNYYILDGGEWQTVRALPGGIHCFDAAQLGDLIFFGLGVTHESSPIVMFNGSEYLPIPFYKDGVCPYGEQNEIIRVYNLFIYRGQLYAFLSLDGEGGVTMELYLYDGGAFEFVSGVLPSEDMREVAVLGDSVFMVIGDTLLLTSNLTSFKALSLGSGYRVFDLISDGEAVYALASKKTTSGLFETSVFTVAPDGSYQKLAGVLARNIGGSFTKHDGSFFISLGSYDEITYPHTAGKIVKIK